MILYINIHMLIYLIINTILCMKIMHITGMKSNGKNIGFFRLIFMWILVTLIGLPLFILAVLVSFIAHIAKHTK